MLTCLEAARSNVKPCVNIVWQPPVGISLLSFDSLRYWAIDTDDP